MLKLNLKSTYLFQSLTQYTLAGNLVMPQTNVLPVSVISVHVQALFLQTPVTFSSPNENTQFERLRKT